MVTSKKYYSYLGDTLIASSWSLKAANKKLTNAVLKRAVNGESTALIGQVRTKKGDVLIHREFLQATYGDSSDHLEDSAPPIFHSH